MAIKKQPITAKAKTNVVPIVQSFAGQLTTRGFASKWEPAQLLKAETTADKGDYSLAGALIEAMRSDERIRGTLDARIKGLLSLPLKFQPARTASDTGTAKAGQNLITELDEDLSSIAPEHIRAEMLFFAILFGFAVAQITYSEMPRLDGATRLIPSLNIIHPTNIIEKDQKLYCKDINGIEIEITENDGQWFIYAPNGLQRAWAKGHWRALSRFFLAKQYASIDWLRFSEKHGQGVFATTLSKDAVDLYNDDTLALAKSELSNFFASLGREKGIALPPGFDLKLIEAQANSYQVFNAQIEQCNMAIAISILGQNLTTEVSGNGSFAAAKSHAGVKAEIIAHDSVSFCDALRAQVISFWAQFNFNDANLAPWFHFETEIPADINSVVSTWNNAGNAIKNLLDMGLPVDLLETAKKIGVPLIEAAALKPNQQEIFAYNMDYGLFTINEIRISKGYPAIPGGDVIPMPVANQQPANPAAIQNSIKTYAADPNANVKQSDGQSFTDNICTHALDITASETDGITDTCMAIINGVDETDPQWERTIFKALIDQFDPSAPQFQKILERAMVLCELMGKKEVIANG